MLALTGCGDDDDKGGPEIPPPSMPSLKPLVPTPTMPPLGSKPPADSGSSESPTGLKPAASSAKAGASDLTTLGVCLTKSASGSLVKTSCTGEHLGEVAALFTLPDSMDPSSATFKDENRAKCQELLLPIIGRQPNAADLGPLASGPSVKSWNTDKDRTLACIVTTKGDAKLNAPLVK